MTAAIAQEALAADDLKREEQLAASGSGTATLLNQGRATAAVASARVAALQAELDLARAGGSANERLAAEQRVAAADADLRIARARYSWTRVVAPIRGTVLVRHVDPGDMAFSTAFGNTLFEIADTDKPEVRIEFEEADASRIAVGLPVTLRRDDAPIAYSGRVTRVGAHLEPRTVGAPGGRDRADAQVRVAWAEIDWPAEQGSVVIGERFDALVALPPLHANAVLPRRAVSIDDGVATVEVRQAIGWRKTPVRLAESDEHAVSILGLSPNMEVRLP
jgi:multidrug efflux pump subunit AcrA (membrane-fusion protein)